MRRCVKAVLTMSSDNTIGVSVQLCLISCVLPLGTCSCKSVCWSFVDEAASGDCTASWKKLPIQPTHSEDAGH